MCVRRACGRKKEWSRRWCGESFTGKKNKGKQGEIEKYGSVRAVMAAVVHRNCRTAVAQEGEDKRGQHEVISQVVAGSFSGEVVT